MPVPVKGPVLAAELIVAMPQLEAILQGPTPEDTANNRRVFAGNLEIDTFFIAAYTGLFLAIAWEIRLAATPQQGLTWIAATLFAIGAAVA